MTDHATGATADTERNTTGSQQIISADGKRGGDGSDEEGGGSDEEGGGSDEEGGGSDEEGGGSDEEGGGSDEEGDGSDTTRTTNTDTPPETTPPPSPQKLALSSDDMGENLTRALQELEHIQGANKPFSVPLADITLAQLQDAIDADDDGWQYTAITYKPGSKGEGHARVFASKDKHDLDWSAFSKEVKRPTVEEARKFFEDAVQHPPTGDIPYHTGHANIPLQPLNPGPQILTVPVLKDLHTEYHHIGGNGAASRIHCEDFTSEDPASPTTYHGFRSYNEVYFGTGYKLWLFIETHHTAKFNRIFKKNPPGKECDQAIAHQCLFIAPSRLDKEGIDFRIEILGRGEGVATSPGILHQTINYGACAARSVNDLHPGEELTAENIFYCCQCDMARAYEKLGAKRVPPPTEPRKPLVSRKPLKRPAPQDYHTGRATRACTEAKQRLNELEAYN
ncbi:hypothetical protein ACJ41O_006479 [Fusarium nematophilum]